MDLIPPSPPNFAPPPKKPSNYSPGGTKETSVDMHQRFAFSIVAERQVACANRATQMCLSRLTTLRIAAQREACANCPKKGSASEGGGVLDLKRSICSIGEGGRGCAPRVRRNM